VAHPVSIPKGALLACRRLGCAFGFGRQSSTGLSPNSKEAPQDTWLRGIFPHNAATQPESTSDNATDDRFPLYARWISHHICGAAERLHDQVVERVPSCRVLPDFSPQNVAGEDGHGRGARALLVIREQSHREEGFGGQLWVGLRSIERGVVCVSCEFMGKGR